ncbi:RnfABCDGE type electron transport complex subunit D [Exilibacterium tricleocarpae]|uniref:RnfABCDGE type electron transport complex subunit D n=1 Tax=Exilibacterium tricleocarpae TaxID=2591008 RepID=A0A545U9M3_9GAMM|nr:RnfABCDGE type electron transport complex subunit D [Exilibacterium tricleocarpae]TQV86161.1 RnfABCDGE type electron transport complex subunit D [Exilibacterium tricleocarpae]
MNKQMQWVAARRFGGLLRFSLALTALNILGHSILGFEMAPITPFFTVSVAILFQLSIDVLEGYAFNKEPAYLRLKGRELIAHFLPAYITSLAIGMLLFSNGSLGELAFAVIIAIASKQLIKAPFSFIDKTNPEKPVKRTSYRHFLNPSNFGISVTLLVCPWVGIAPPYQFAEGLVGIWDWIIPLVLLCAGSFLNWRFTDRLVLIISWFFFFVVQAAVRAWWHDTSLVAGLIPMTGIAFILFSFYMITDPPTSPASKRGQILFGLSNAVLYAFFMEINVVFGLFYALTITTFVRGLYCWWAYASQKFSFAGIRYGYQLSRAK